MQPRQASEAYMVHTCLCVKIYTNSVKWDHKIQYRTRGSSDNATHDLHPIGWTEWGREEVFACAWESVTHTSYAQESPLYPVQSHLTNRKMLFTTVRQLQGLQHGVSAANPGVSFNSESVYGCVNVLSVAHPKPLRSFSTLLLCGVWKLDPDQWEMINSANFFTVCTYFTVFVFMLYHAKVNFLMCLGAVVSITSVTCKMTTYCTEMSWEI